MKYDYRNSLFNSKVNKSIKKVEKFEWKHKNLILLGVGIVLSYLAYRAGITTSILGNLGSFGYVGAVISGFFFSHGITTVPAIAAFYVLGKTLNPFLMAFAGAIGALLSDYLIFKFVRDRLLEEIRDLSHGLSEVIPRMQFRIKRSTYFKWIIPTVAGFIIASPLPDEMAAALFAVAKYDLKKFVIFSFVSKFIGLLAIAYAARLL